MNILCISLKERVMIICAQRDLLVIHKFDCTLELELLNGNILG
jgi:hypothetical protein